jgi:hypothetical protein
VAERCSSFLRGFIALELAFMNNLLGLLSLHISELFYFGIFMKFKASCMDGGLLNKETL